MWIDYDDGHAGGYPHECERCPTCGLHNDNPRALYCSNAWHLTYEDRLPEATESAPQPCRSTPQGAAAPPVGRSGNPPNSNGWGSSWDGRNPKASCVEHGLTWQFYVMRGAIRAIAPAADVRQIVGWAVFRYELNEKYDMAHVPVSPMFPKIEQARNSCKEFNARKPGDHVICEVRSTT